MWTVSIFLKEETRQETTVIATSVTNYHVFESKPSAWIVNWLWCCKA